MSFDGFVNIIWNNRNLLYNIAVAPFVGAWIEIFKTLSWRISIISSLPSWERGLKSEVFRPHRRTFRVAPFVGAWIEIWETLNKKGFVFVAPFVGAWIEISIGTSFAMIADCRSLRGSVDWNPYLQVTSTQQCRRSLRGSVDWNRIVHE